MRATLVTIVGAVLLASCVAQEASYTLAPTSTRDQGPPVTLAPTVTRAPSPSIKPSPTEVTLPKACVQPRYDSSAPSDSKGVVVLNRLTDDIPPIEEPYLLDLESGKVRDLAEPGSFAHGATVSPDRRSLAYEQFRRKEYLIYDEWIILSSADGTVQSKFKPPGVLDGWFSDSALWLTLAGEYPADLVAYSLEDGSETVLRNPNPDLLALGAVSWGQGRVYDPRLTRVVFPGRLILGEDGEWILAWFLSDVATGSQLATVPTGNPYPAEGPLWTVQGDKVVVVGGDGKADLQDFFSISRDGEVRRLTHLGDVLPGHDVRRYSWSPSGDKIVFFLREDRESKSRERLFVLDVASGQLIDLCVEGETLAESYQVFRSRTPAPIWSPDGSQLLVEARDPDGTIQVLIVDPSAGQAVEIAEHARPVGWMAAN